MGECVCVCECVSVSVYECEYVWAGESVNVGEWDTLCVSFSRQEQTLLCEASCWSGPGRGFVGFPSNVGFPSDLWNSHLVGQFLFPLEAQAPRSEAPLLSSLLPHHSCHYTQLFVSNYVSGPQPDPQG